MPIPSFDFARAPFIVIWEATRACALACVHCRADAIPRRNAGELSTEEGFRLIDEDLGLSLQINTTISRLTLPQLEQMASRVADFPLSMWAVFFLVQTGRGASLDQISDVDCERVLNYLYDFSCTAPFAIKTTEAPHFHRVIWQRQHEGLPFSRTCEVTARPGLRAPRSVTDGNGFLFIDHLGNVCPSGFLPLVRGNVRTGDLATIYREDEVFLRLRDTGSLGGKCGRCEFRDICGGSRARAFTATGALMASDPLCAYEPGPVISGGNPSSPLEGKIPQPSGSFPHGERTRAQPRDSRPRASGREPAGQTDGVSVPRRA